MSISVPLAAAKGGERQTSIQVISAVIKNEGISGLYVGLSAGLFRQVNHELHHKSDQLIGH